MPREQIAGGIIVEQLRDRILAGMFLGQWRPGERLPSIRDVADAENVDRKTAAAAYRRLQREGLVDVRARSGVYLKQDTRHPQGGPLQRLERRWLENTYETGHEIGLDTQGMIRLLGAVASVERRPIPVVEADWSQAEVLANELRERLGARTVPFLVSQLNADDRVIAEAPFFVTTPFQRSRVIEVAGSRPVVQLILTRDLIDQIRRSMARGPVLIVVPSEDVASKVRSALLRGTDNHQGNNARVLVPSDPERLVDAAELASCVFLWPGTPGWIVRQLESLHCVIPGRCIADESLTAVRSALLSCAMSLLARTETNDRFNMSSGAEPRSIAAASGAVG